MKNKQCVSLSFGNGLTEAQQKIISYIELFCHGRHMKPVTYIVAGREVKA